ncbi:MULTISPECIES: YoaK family protein [unclassified Streptomyces]|uniref:YoaK family protein n=1 Tax=unclassified Streptomyces TaxID=2593676 RepID=UPI0019067348|nr:DUF1275 family protein [Streptomyces sp. HSG2]
MSEETTASFTVSSLVITANGYTDAYLFIAHGGVFAGAQTGNLVLFCVDLARPDTEQPLSRLWPILAFVAGVIVAESLLGLRSRSGRPRNPLAYALVLEAAVLATVALAPAGLPQSAVTTSVGFSAALQVVFFQAVRPATFLPIAMTGNLTRFTHTALTARRTRSRSDLRLAVLYASVLVLFGAGAAAGALATEVSGTDASLYVAAIYVSACALFVRSARRAGRGGDRAGAPSGGAGGGG